MWALNRMAEANLRHLGSVCWQPTALGGNNVGFKLQGRGPKIPKVLTSFSHEHCHMSVVEKIHIF